MKLCTHTVSILPISVKEQLKILKENNFDSVMLFWYKDLFDTQVNKFPEEARRLGLDVENVHIPYFGAETLWDDNISGDETFKMILRCINEMNVNEIKKGILHPSGWKTTTDLSKIGLDRFNRIVELAEKNDITIALENISDTKVLDFLFSNIDSEKLKFCYDNGHENIFSKKENLLVKHGKRLAALHLTDNDGEEDSHNLPFDGNFDWKSFMSNLKKIDYNGPLAFEVGWQLYHKEPKYSNDNYVKELKNRASKILSL